MTVQSDRNVFSPLLVPAFCLAVATFAWFVLWSPDRPLSSPDEEIYLRTTLAFREGETSIEPLPDGFGTRRGRGGKQYPQYGPALSFLAAPWVAVGDSLAGTVLDMPQGDTDNPAFHEDWERFAETFYSFTRHWIGYFNGVVTSLTVVILFLWASRISNPRVGFLVAAFYPLLTIAWPHGRTLFSEPLAALGIFAALWLLLRDKQTLGAQSEKRIAGLIPSEILAGICYALAVLTRVDSLSVAPPLFLVAALRRPAKSGDHTAGSLSDFQVLDLKSWTFARLVKFAAPLFVAVLLIGYYNHLRFGLPWATGYEDQPEGINFDTPVLIGLHGFLLSPGRSLFVFSPILLLAPFGFYHLWNKDRLLCAALLCTTAFLTLAMSCWRNWAGGWDWGPRHIFQVTPLLALSLAACPWKAWWRSYRWRAALLSLVALSFGVQLLGVSEDAVEVVRAVARHPFDLQFMVYDPYRIPPVRHFQALQSIPNNLLWWQSFQLGRSWCWVVLIPLIGWFGALAGAWFWARRSALNDSSELVSDA